jgi:uncharacterized protein
MVGFFWGGAGFAGGLGAATALALTACLAGAGLGTVFWGAAAFLAIFALAALRGAVRLALAAVFFGASFLAVAVFFPLSFALAGPDALVVDLIRLSFPIKNPFEIAVHLAYSGNSDNQIQGKLIKDKSAFVNNFFLARVLGGVPTMSELNACKERLTKNLKGYRKLMVAFSGGVDSTLLLKMAQLALGKEVVAVTATSPIHSERETEYARKLADELGVAHILLRSEEMGLPAFVANGPDRCYHCKKQLFRRIFEQAEQLGIAHVAHGANIDDLQDFRPGLQATRELGVAAPLVDAGFAKGHVRRLARELGLPNWNQPARACLASRIPYGQEISEPVLEMVARAEEVLRNLGFDACRVRHHGTVARIEIPLEDLRHILTEPLRRNIVERLRKVGYAHVALDLEGYRQGSLNRELAQ